MLDQNTDRMWYVIGAVIVGAALIFLMNGTFPELFAAVGNTFNDKVEDAAQVVEETTMTDGAGVIARPNLIDRSRVTHGYLDIQGKYVAHLPNSAYYNYTTDFIDVSTIDHITVSLYDSILPEDVGSRPDDYGRIFGYDKDKKPVRLVEQEIHWRDPTHQTYNVSDVQYIRANLLLQQTHRYKIEAGKHASAYN